MTKQVNRDSFYRLASDLESERVKGAVTLVNDLSERAVNDEDASEWDYVLHRLIKGLASSNQSARLGFSTCLAEVVALSIKKGHLKSIDEYIALMLKLLSKEKVKNGNEERGKLFGRLFGLQTLLNEPLFSIAFKVEKGSISNEFVVSFTRHLSELAHSKPWLREPCLFTLYQTVEKLAGFFDESMLRSMFNILDEYQFTLTNEGLTIYLHLLYKCEETRKITENTDLLSNLDLRTNWKNNNPLASGNAKLLVSVLKDVVPAESDGLKQKGSWAPRLHFVWDIILPLICRVRETRENDAHVSKKRKKRQKLTEIQFPEFWQTVVEEVFFSEKASSERKYLGILILEKTIQIIPQELVQQVFSKNVMRTLINQSVDSKRNLHKITSNLLNQIGIVCEKQPNKTVNIIESLWFGPNGTINFDRLTKSKTVHGILISRSIDDGILATLVACILKNIQKEHDNFQITTFGLDTLLHIVKGHRSKASFVWLEQLLQYIVKLAFFDLNDKIGPHSQTNNEELQSLAKERLFSILGELIPLSKSTNSTTWSYVTLQILLTNAKTATLSLKLDKELEEVAKKALETLVNIRADYNNPEADLKLKSLEQLLSVCLLQLYAGDTDAVSVLEELISFYSKSGNEVNTLVGLTELLLSMLAQKKAMLRKLSMLVWESLVVDVGKEQLEILVEVLSARENKEGFASLFEAADEYVDISEDEDSNSECDSHHVHVHGSEGENERKETEDYEDSGSGSDSGSESNSEEDDESTSDAEQGDDVARIDKETTSALATALKLPDNILKDNGDIGYNIEDDGEESEEESMDDEAMLELDDQLSAIFKRRNEALHKVQTGNQRKLEVKELRESVISFKHRILDMLEIYYKHIDRTINCSEKCTSRMCYDLLSTIKPLIKCMQQTTDKALADKSARLLKANVCKLKVSYISKDVDGEHIISYLKDLHSSAIASKPGQFPNLYYSTCSTTSLFLAKVLNAVSNNESSYASLIDIYAESMKNWVSNGKFGRSFFIDFVNWLESKKSKN
ncbi:HCR018Wp [Eremothecium sinecaudum]|uniref:HCR018Wp n=1 Tax=Eremothecium sinecaudum TaxID=45286 RepID=A0A0X8HRM3_9SACH|nr:HCR018Wp [Eremothecium sinecaudum]AMD20168.1 HCR018Wp [Eremothecium sinecaudum]